VITDMAERGGLATTFTIEDEARTRLSTEAELVLYRALQEGLANVVRHAQASRIDITLRHTPQMVQLTVTDDGTGFSPAEVRSGAMGLTGMRERALALGGRLSITSSPGAGTSLLIALPGEQANGEASAPDEAAL
jgi:signal transduction histidine kinase